jgi:hypothetical protein
MDHSVSEKIVAISHRLYHLLIVICHSKFRRRYGREMGQVFRDRCDKAWRQGGPAELIGWWIMALIDLARTAVATHVYAFEQGDVEMKSVLLTTAQGIFGCGGIILLFYTMVKRPMPYGNAGILLCGVIASLSAALGLHWAAAFRAVDPGEARRARRGSGDERARGDAR